MFMNLDKTIRDQALLEVRMLPQVGSGAIPEERVGKWLNQVAKIDPTRIAWHVRRLGGIGGSEIASVMGLNGAYTTREIIAKQKLMIIPPFRATAAMKRGAYSEEFIRDLFEGPPDSSTDQEMSENLRANSLTNVIHDLFGSEMDRKFGRGNWRPRPDLEALVQRPRSNGDLPGWAIGSPDRIYDVKVGGDWRVAVIDFKAPSEKTMADIKRHPEKLLPWRAQVQHYGMILGECGHPPAALVLAVFDYANVGTTTFHLDESVPSPEVCQMMVIEGNRFWNDFILAGRVPEPALVLNPEMAPPAIENAAARSTFLAALRDGAKAALEEAQEPIRDWVLSNPQAHAKVAMGKVGDASLWVPRVSIAFDAEAAIYRLIDTGHMTAEQSLALRGPMESIPPEDPRFGAAVGVAQEKLADLSALVSGLTVNQTLDAATLQAIQALVADAGYCANPMRLGPPKVDLVKTELKNAMEPLEPYETVKLTIARNGAKAAAAVFAGVCGETTEIANAYAARQTRPAPEVVKKAEMISAPTPVVSKIDAPTMSMDF